MKQILINFFDKIILEEFHSDFEIYSFEKDIVISELLEKGKSETRNNL